MHACSHVLTAFAHRPYACCSHILNCVSACPACLLSRHPVRPVLFPMFLRTALHAMQMCFTVRNVGCSIGPKNQCPICCNKPDTATSIAVWANRWVMAVALPAPSCLSAHRLTVLLEAMLLDPSLSPAALLHAYRACVGARVTATKGGSDAKIKVEAHANLSIISITACELYARFPKHMPKRKEGSWGHGMAHIEANELIPVIHTKALQAI